MELCNTLSEENAGSGLITYSIAPGFVKTDTAIKAVDTVAAAMGITSEELFCSHEEYISYAEIAGVGYALSVVNAKQYDGKVVMAYQVVVDSGLISGDTTQASTAQDSAEYDKLFSLFTDIANVFYDQYQNWQKKKLFQKQFILSDFKKQICASLADSANF